MRTRTTEPLFGQELLLQKQTTVKPTWQLWRGSGEYSLIAMQVPDSSVVFWVFFEIKLIYPKIYHFNHYEVFSSVAFSIFRMLCNCYHYLIPEHFHHPKQNPTPINPIPSPCRPCQPLMYSVSIHFPIMDISYKCNRVCGLLCLTSFT